MTCGISVVYTTGRMRRGFVNLGVAILVLVVALVAWDLYLRKPNITQPARSPEPAPTIQEGERSASPAPTATGTIEKIVYKPISSWKTYKDTQAKFSIQYSEEEKIGDSKPGQSVAFISCQTYPDKREVCLPSFNVSIHSDYSGGSRRQWFDKKFGKTLFNPYYEDVLVAGIKALIIMDGNTGGSTATFVLIPKGLKTMYLLDFPFGWNPKTGDKSGLAVIKKILSTFAFI